MKVAQILPVLAAITFAQLAVAPPAQAAGTNAYKIHLSATIQTTNSNGRLVDVRYSNREIIHAAAEASGNRPQDLQLVYDLDADAVQVVLANGGVVWTPLALSGGQTLLNAGGSVAERLAFAFVNEESEARGTVRTTSLVIRNTSPRWPFTRQVTFNLQAFFQYATPASASGGPAIYSGGFATGAKFIPVPTDGGGLTN